jgi:hypothetical protein
MFRLAVAGPPVRPETRLAGGGHVVLHVALQEAQRRAGGQDLPRTPNPTFPDLGGRLHGIAAPLTNRWRFALLEPGAPRRRHGIARAQAAHGIEIQSQFVDLIRWTGPHDGGSLRRYSSGEGERMHSVSDAVAQQPFAVRSSWRGGRGRDPAKVTQELRDRLFRDLTAILSGMHLWGPDFFRPGQGGAVGELVPESALNASLGLCLKQLGWVVEREALQGAGRRDLKISCRGRAAVIEIKRWGRNDYTEIQRRLESGWGPEVFAAVAIMIHDGEAATLVAGYRARCLSRPGLTVAEVPVPAPILRHFRVQSTTADGFHAPFDHLLLRIRRT